MSHFLQHLVVLQSHKKASLMSLFSFRSGHARVTVYGSMDIVQVLRIGKVTKIFKPHYRGKADQLRRG
jgi:hypothetical protein